MAYDANEERGYHGRWGHGVGSPGFKRPTARVEDEQGAVKEPTTLEEHSMVGLLRLAGHHGLDKHQAKALLNHLGHEPADNTIQIQMSNGRRGVQVPKPAEPDRWRKLVKKFKGGDTTQTEAKTSNTAKTSDYWVQLNKDGTADDVNKDEAGHIGENKFVYKVEAKSSTEAVGKAQIRFSNKEDSDHPWGLKQPKPPVSASTDFVLDTEVHGQVSPEFKAKIKQAEDSITPAIRNNLNHFGAKVHLGNFLLEMRPELAGKVPPGWQGSDTWDRADGCASHDSSYVTESYKVDGFAHKSDRAQEVYRHELGHVADSLLSPGTHLSDHPDFVRAHKEDMRVMGNVAKSTYNYQIQPSNPSGGRKEAFAEIFAELHGGGCKIALGESSVSSAFPRTVLIVKRQLGL